MNPPNWMSKVLYRVCGTWYWPLCCRFDGDAWRTSCFDESPETCRRTEETSSSVASMDVLVRFACQKRHDGSRLSQAIDQRRVFPNHSGELTCFLNLVLTHAKGVLEDLESTLGIGSNSQQGWIQLSPFQGRCKATLGKSYILCSSIETSFRKDQPTFMVANGFYQPHHNNLPKKPLSCGCLWLSP